MDEYPSHEPNSLNQVMKFIKNTNTNYDETLKTKLETIRQSDYNLKKFTILIWFIFSLFNVVFIYVFGFPILADWIIISTPCMNFTVGAVLAFDYKTNKLRDIMEVAIPYYILIILLEHQHCIDIKGFDNPEVWAISMMTLFF